MQWWNRRDFRDPIVNNENFCQFILIFRALCTVDNNLAYIMKARVKHMYLMYLKSQDSVKTQGFM